MKYIEEAKQIVKLVGGEENINSLVHCATRLRFELKDHGKADKDALNKLNYVLQVVVSGGQFQVVIGPAVNDYFQAILSVAKIGAGTSEKGDTGQKKGLADQVMKVISGAFSPLIPVLAGAGMVKALLTVILELGLLPADAPTYLILSAAGNAAFYFLPVFLGITLAKQFGGNAYVGGAIGAALLEPNFTGLLQAEGAVNFLGIRVIPIDYASTVFPIFIAVIVYSQLEKLLKKTVKKELQLFLNPMISLMLMVPFTVLVFGPFGTVLGNKVSDTVVWLFGFNRILAGAVLGVAYPFLTILGLHWGFTPVTIQNLENFGGDMLEGVCVCAVFAEIGIAVGAYLKGKKHSKIREVAGPTILTAVFAGVTEPILYGIIMNYKRLMKIVAISSGIGGAINGAFHVTCDAFVFHNIFALAMQTYSPFYAYLIGISAALVSGALLTYFWGITAEDKEDFTAEGSKESEEAIVQEAAAGGTPIRIQAPMAGEVIALEEVEDEVFASGVAGLGIALRPSEDVVKAPCDGEVSMIFPSKHAIGLAVEGGAEMLIHVGLNTVMLNGEGFQALVAEGDKVTAGQPLLRFDPAFIKAQGCPLTTPVLVTNADEFQGIETAAHGQVKAGELIYRIMR
ncbi:MAG: glucose PTS transporter subunit IIA [Eubacterium sp.]|nr:glucose PTS transporter subunit IIA [Eubacterium sp.]